jgi:hypothetical protein
MSSRYPMPIAELLRRRFNTPLLFVGALGACVFLLAACTGDGSPAAPEAAAPGELSASVVKIPLEGTDTLFLPCVGDVELQFREQIVVHESVDAQGKIHFHIIINDKGTTAVSLTTGASYHLVGAQRETNKFVESSPVMISFGNIFNLIGQGSAPDLILHETFHLTVNATGVVTVERETQRIECK